MRLVRPLVHLVAQREALERLESEDSGHVETHDLWKSNLQPSERAALKAYDQMVDLYKRTVPPVAKSKFRSRTLH